MKDRVPEDSHVTYRTSWCGTDPGARLTLN